MKKSILSVLVLAIWAINSPANLISFEKNSNPSSGRQLGYGHWLSCDGASDEVVRQTDGTNRDTPEEKVEETGPPKFNGQYGFAVKDMWEETVTKYGTSCLHCGEECSGSGKNRSCTCNSCSWSETETFSRPWSTQTTKYKVEWIANPQYRQKRTEWMKNKTAIAHDAGNVAQLMKFDPDRPTEYWLFPGETERITIDNDSGTVITPKVKIGNEHAKYSINTTVNGRTGSRACDDIDLEISAEIQTGDRIVADQPNSVEFKSDVVDAPKDPQGHVSQEPTEFKLVDTSAFAYEGQNVYKHYKTGKVRVRLREINRYYWVDRWITGTHELKDTESTLAYQEENSGLPPFTEYQLDSSKIMLTPIFHSRFHLKPGKSYEICAAQHRDNNIYYRTQTAHFWEHWSAWNCSVFTYDENAPDNRSGGRKFHDGLVRWNPIPFPWF